MGVAGSDGEASFGMEPNDPDRLMVPELLAYFLRNSLDPTYFSESASSSRVSESTENPEGGGA